MGKSGSKEAKATAIPKELEDKLLAMFKKMDTDGNGTVDKTEAIAFWGKNWAKARPPGATAQHLFLAPVARSADPHCFPRPSCR